MPLPRRLLLALILPISAFVSAADLPREHGLARDMEHRADTAEILLLEAGGTRFAARFRDAVKADGHGGIVLLNDLDAPPETFDLPRLLGLQLPERGWATLTLQTPLREAGAPPGDYLPLLLETVARIRAAIAYLQSRQFTSIVLLGYRSGGLGVLRYLSGEPDPSVRAGVMVNTLPTGDQVVDDTLLADLPKVKRPLLDLIGGRGQSLDADLSQQRRRLMKANAGYRLTVIADARTDLNDVAGLLINRIHGWLSRLPESADAASPPTSGAP
jgi:hypothetical protein